MGFLAELLVYAAAALGQVLFDLFILGVAEGVAALLRRYFGGAARQARREALICALLGASVGTLSLLVYPTLLAQGTLARLLMLLVTPMLAAILFGRLWRNRRTLDPGAATICAWCFAQAMVLARLLGGN